MALTTNEIIVAANDYKQNTIIFYIKNLIY